MNASGKTTSGVASEETAPVLTIGTPSRWRLLFQSYLSLIAAVALGTLISAPILYSRIRCFTESIYIVGASPSDDARLTAWALSRPGVVGFRTDQRGSDLWLRSEYFSLKEQPPSGQVIGRMKELGYEFRGMRGASTGMASTFQELLTDPQTLAGMLAGIQVAFGFIGLQQIRAAMRKKIPMPPLFPRPHGRAIAAGVIAGLLLLGAGVLYAMGLEAILGYPAPSPWDSTTSMPATVKLVLLAFGAVGAPITEELFFRGYLFGRFKGAGYVWFGICVSAILFGAVHFSDIYNVPGICLVGVVLAWLYHRTGSLLAPIIAHVVNNGVLIALMGMNVTPATPDHALQRTAPHFTLAAADHRTACAYPAPAVLPQPVRRAPQSLSLSMGDPREDPISWMRTPLMLHARWHP